MLGAWTFRMKLPNSEDAYVAREKITRYLLNRDNPDGESKAKFFSRFGFDKKHWNTLAEAFRLHALRHPVVSIIENDRGVRYALDGELETPDGRNPYVRVVWMVDKGNNIPRLITVYPQRRRNA